MTATHNVLEAEGVSCAYGRFKVLDKVDLTLGAGEIRALIGPNGAGKSSLLKVLSGEQPPTEGRVRLAGQDVTGATPRKLRRRGLSRSFQTSRLVADVTVRDQLTLACQAFAARPYSMWRSFERSSSARSSADELLRQLEFSHLGDAMATDLSYADQRKLEFALVLTGDPTVLLLDEPTSGMSREESVAFADVIATLRAARGLSVVIVEHDLDVVFRIADRVTVLHRGAVMCEGEPRDVVANQEVQHAYLGV